MCYGYPEICPSKTCLTPLNPATNATFDLLAGLFKDLTGGKARSGLFPDDFFHLGGDEVPDEKHSCWREKKNDSLTLCVSGEHGLLVEDARSEAVDG